MKPGLLNPSTLKIRRKHLLMILAVVLPLFLLVGCAGKEKTAPQPTLHFLQPPKIQPDPSRLGPGLEVLYFHDFYRNINQMPKGEKILLRGKPAQPILVLDHQFGDGEVFNTGLSRGVGFQMTGYLKFDQAGTYGFKANTNDGFRMFLSRKMILDDPTVHSDRFTNRAYVKVTDPGWYPLKILYFQRKGTATLQLFWQKPDSNEFEIVPPVAYAHIAPIK